MREDTTIPLRRPALREALSEPVRAGAQRIIRQAVEAEPVAFPEEHAGAHDASGGRRREKTKTKKRIPAQGRNDERKPISSGVPSSRFRPRKEEPPTIAGTGRDLSLHKRKSSRMGFFNSPEEGGIASRCVSRRWLAQTLVHRVC